MSSTLRLFRISAAAMRRSFHPLRISRNLVYRVHDGTCSYIHVSVWLPQSEGIVRIIACAFAKLLRGNFSKLEGKGYHEEGKCCIVAPYSVFYVCALTTTPLFACRYESCRFYVVHYTAATRSLQRLESFRTTIAKRTNKLYHFPRGVCFGSMDVII